MTAEGDAANFTAGELNHKRGQGFAAMNAGLSYGNGHQKPTWLSPARDAIVENLLADPDLQRLAAYQDGKLIHLFSSLAEFLSKCCSFVCPLAPKGVQVLQRCTR